MGNFKEKHGRVCSTLGHGWTWMTLALVNALCTAVLLFIGISYDQDGWSFTYPILAYIFWDVIVMVAGNFVSSSIQEKIKSLKLQETVIFLLTLDGCVSACGRHF